MYNNFPLAFLGCNLESILLAKVLRVFIFNWYSIAMFINFPCFGAAVGAPMAVGVQQAHPELNHGVKKCPFLLGTVTQISLIKKYMTNQKLCKARR